ncbi:hypothetical protein [Methylobacterium sp. J-077]|uniref:hypothetical protein n=1 Tax=Methylobacterium sp. J-077 TaxID=2836656 RepID=UPI001FBAB59A|nr:hypothetical protein [Methylobacterium sp. J-077]MCJ2126777.1 hypothetical protein [Methylobacterium sp. J-077]
MLEYKASLALRVEIVETALTAIFETLPKGHAARDKLVELVKAKIADVGFAYERRHELENVLAVLVERLDAQEADQR